jgi:putative tricarboxylic transport membrane protein
MRFDSATADRVTAIVLLALGAAMTWGGFVMDRLEIRQIHPASIPGLVPMILGLAMMLCAVLLALNADGADRKGPEGGSWGSFAFTALWSCFFAVILVSRIPFAAAVAIYVTGFAGWFLLPDISGAKRVKTALFIVAFGVITAAAVSALFRYGFLVRLP